MHNLGERTMSTNTKNIVLVHDGWADGSSRSKEIAILKNAEQQLITVQLVEYSLADDPDVQRRRKRHSLRTSASSSFSKAISSWIGSLACSYPKA